MQELRYIVGMKAEHYLRNGEISINNKPACLGFNLELKRKGVNCRCRCDLRDLCKRLDPQFKGELTNV